MTEQPGYLCDPEEIYRRSFATIRAEAALDGLPDRLDEIVVRMVHACGMTDIVADLTFTDGVVAAGVKALRSGAPILTDGRMTAAGIIRGHLPADNKVACMMEHPDAAGRARALKITRSAAAIDLFAEKLDGAVVAIGNAPTALFRLLDFIAETGIRPALLYGFPVGFVGAAESKDALAARGPDLGIEFLTLRGRRGGSAIAASAVNALAVLARAP